MSKYIISLYLLFLACIGWSQSSARALQLKDTIQKTDSYGIRFGIDLSRLLKSSLNSAYTGIEIVGDYRVTPNLYLAAELGNEKKTKQEELYNFTTSGSYLKIGVAYNTYENWYGMSNLIHIGGRYAVSSFSQTLNNYQIFSTSRYFEDSQFANGSDEPEKFSALNASWLEAVLGTKVELFSNLYLGASVRIGFLITNKEEDRFPNLWIPGFNKVTDNSKFGTSYNYTISYLIPLYKKKKEVRKKYRDVGEVQNQNTPAPKN